MDAKGSAKKLKFGCERDSDWEEPIALLLEALLLENLCLIFESAIVEISEWGYSEEAAQKALLRRGLFVGSKNPVSTIVNDTLEGLFAKKKITTTMEESFDSIQSLANYTLLEMTGVIREVRPFLSAAEALWWLLISDLNVLQACRLEEEFSGGMKSSGSSENFSEMIITQLRAHTQNHVTDMAAFGEFLKHIKPKGPNGEDINLASMMKNLDCFLKNRGENEKSTGAGRNGHSKSSTARNLAKSSYYIGRTCKGHGSKGIAALENKLKTVSGASSASLKKTGSSKTNSGLGDKSTVANSKRRGSANTPSTSSGTGNSSKSSLPTEGSKNLVKKSSPDLKPVTDFPDIKPSRDYYALIPYDKQLGKHVAKDDKDEILLKLVPRLQDLQKEAQSWTDWANQKIMQATRKLSKIQPELKTMRQVTAAAKTFMHENNTKRLATMENGVNGINSLLENGRSIISSLESQNALLKEELKLAKDIALESAAKHLEALDREQKTQKMIQSWDGKIGFMCKNLDAEKKELAALQQDLGKAKNSHHKFEAKLEREKKETEKLVAEAALIKREIEQLKIRAKAEEDGIKQRAKTTIQKSLEVIGKLESRFSEALSRSDSSRITALKKGATESFGNRLVEAKSFVAMSGIRDFEDHFGIKGLRRERECVMCLSEEISVVFVPCSHQVLCEKCNELHRNRGMKDCPSCRTSIQRRIKVRFAKP